MISISRQDKLNLLKTMLKIRKFEELVDRLVKQGLVTGTTHLYIGEEAIATGACYALEKEDYITSNHRGHGHCIARSNNLKRTLAELLGRRSGFCKGKGGSMHIASLSDGILGANGIVGGSIGIATGAAFSIKKQNLNKVVICFIGDGATNQGIFYESINLAKLWSLPIIYLCENNLYAISAHIKDTACNENLSERIKGFKIEAKRIDGNDVELVYENIKQMVEKCRNGEGPFFLECLTYRTLGHSRSDSQPYRKKREDEKWIEKDPIDRYKKKLLKERIITESEWETINFNIIAELEKAQVFSEKSEDPVEDDLYSGIFY